MYTRRQLMILIQFLLLIFLLGCSNESKASEFLKYQDENNHFSIEYPSNWSVDTNQKGINVMFDSPKVDEQDVNTESFSVTAVQLPQEANLPIERYKDGIINTVKKQSPWIKVEYTKELTVNGYPALQISYSGKRNNLDASFQLTYIMKGNMGYVLTYACLMNEQEKYSTIIDKMINSFVITH